MLPWPRVKDADSVQRPSGRWQAKGHGVLKEAEVLDHSVLDRIQVGTQGSLLFWNLTVKG